MNTNVLYTPETSGRKVLDEDTGADFRSLEHDWTDKLQKERHRNRALTAAIAVLALVLALFAAALLYLALFRGPEPYVLEVDESGKVSFGGRLSSDFSVTDEMIPSQLMDFVENWRTVTPDNTQQKRRIARLYCMVTDRAPSRERLNEYFREPQNDPFKRNVNLSVTTEIRQISKLSGATWQVEWYETTRAHDGRIEGERATWRATLIAEQGRVQPACLEGNPLGIYVQELNWTQAR